MKGRKRRRRRGGEAKEEGSEVVSRVAARDARARGARSGIGNVVKCVTDA